MKSITSYIRKNNHYFLLGIIFLVHVFFQFYNLTKWATFGWDQVDNAWAAMRILIVHKYPIVGMVAKENSGIYIGPLYYYLAALFYSLTHFNPIASPLLAGTTSLFGFGCLYWVTSRIFGKNTALWAAGIYTFSFFIIRTERNQWPVNFIAPLSILIFYFLYKSLTDNTRYILPTAFCIGLFFHIHFTAVFYPIIVIFILPFLPKTKQTVIHITLSLILFIFLQIPQLIYYFSKYINGDGNYLSYFRLYFHGFHLRRIIQLVYDAMIEFEAILSTPYSFLRPVIPLIIPMFLIAYYKSKIHKKAFPLMYLTLLWICVPWLIFSTYSGEISDYYFISQLYIAVMILAFFTVLLMRYKNLLLRSAVIVFWVYFAYANITAYAHYPEGNLLESTHKVRQSISELKKINFTNGDPESYLYYYLLYLDHKPEPFRL